MSSRSSSTESEVRQPEGGEALLTDNHQATKAFRRSLKSYGIRVLEEFDGMMASIRKKHDDRLESMDAVGDAEDVPSGFLNMDQPRLDTLHVLTRREEEAAGDIMQSAIAMSNLWADYARCVRRRREEIEKRLGYEPVDWEEKEIDPDEIDWVTKSYARSKVSSKAVNAVEETWKEHVRLMELTSAVDRFTYEGVLLEDLPSHQREVKKRIALSQMIKLIPHARIWDQIWREQQPSSCIYPPWEIAKIFTNSLRIQRTRPNTFEELDNYLTAFGDLKKCSAKLLDEKDLTQYHYLMNDLRNLSTDHNSSDLPESVILTAQNPRKNAHYGLEAIFESYDKLSPLVQSILENSLRRKTAELILRFSMIDKLHTEPNDEQLEKIITSVQTDLVMFAPHTDLLLKSLHPEARSLIADELREKVAADTATSHQRNAASDGRTQRDLIDKQAHEVYRFQFPKVPRNNPASCETPSPEDTSSDDSMASDDGIPSEDNAAVEE